MWIVTLAVNGTPMWPDLVEPPMKLDKALNVAKAELAEYEDDFVYCINAVLKNGMDNDQSTGWWDLSYATELGASYAVAVRMDGRVSVKRIQGFSSKTQHEWPSNISPPLMLEAAVEKAEMLMTKQGKPNHYCLVASLVTDNKSDVYKGGIWNLVFQTTENDPRMVNVRMSGKATSKKFQKLKQGSD
jgi:hypothetical protein